MVDADGYAAGEVLNPSRQAGHAEALWDEAELSGGRFGGQGRATVPAVGDCIESMNDRGCGASRRRAADSLSRERHLNGIPVFGRENVETSQRPCDRCPNDFDV
jgi:hypothetical protein